MHISDPPELFNSDNSIEVLSDALTGGYLSLFIGTGISKFSTPQFSTWQNLVASCCKKALVTYDPAKFSPYANDYLLDLIDEVEDKVDANEYLNIVNDCLYDGISYNISTLQTDLLIAVGSLIMGSIRGSATIVINYNFDDLIEWYLSYHGYRIEIISTYPDIIRASDVTIFHPHGFLPSQKKFEKFRTDKIIFSHRSYRSANTDPCSAWNEIQRTILSTKCALFIGMSGDDAHIQNLCHYTYSHLLQKKRIIGFILLKRDNKNLETEKANKRIGLINLYVDDYPDIPNKLLEICRLASGL